MPPEKETFPDFEWELWFWNEAHLYLNKTGNYLRNRQSLVRSVIAP